MPPVRWRLILLGLRLAHPLAHPRRHLPQCLREGPFNLSFDPSCVWETLHSCPSTAVVAEVVDRREELPHQDHPGVPATFCQDDVRRPPGKRPDQGKGEEV